MSGGVGATLHDRRVVLGLTIVLATVVVGGVAVIVLASQLHGRSRSSHAANTACPPGGPCTGWTPTASVSAAGVSPTATQVAVAVPAHAADPNPSPPVT